MHGQRHANLSIYMQIYVGLLIYLQIYANWKKTVIMKNFNLLKVFVHCENTVVSPSIKHTTFNTHFHFENKFIEKKTSTAVFEGWTKLQSETLKFSIWCSIHKTFQNIKTFYCYLFRLFQSLHNPHCFHYLFWQGIKEKLQPYLLRYWYYISKIRN